MFCGGAYPARAELRLPSFKGALRFWWRALAWTRLEGSLDEIQREEDDLFGSANGGQSRVSMRLASAPPETVDRDEILTVSAQGSRRVVGDGARYLGYGVMAAFGTDAGKLTRSCLRAPFDFTVKMRCRASKSSQLDSLQRSLIALGVFGGMGAKSRKGYGSLAMQSLRVDGAETWQPPQTLDALQSAIADLLPVSSFNRKADYTALTSESRHILAASDSMDQPLHLLDLIGREMVRYRSWGHNGKILDGQPSERNFEDDHDLMKMARRERKTHPRRIAFGLPHNYGSSPDKHVGPRDRAFDRRASPLFIHVHQCAQTPVAVLSLLPARFLPSGRSNISVGGSRVRQEPESELYQPIHDFLDRLLDPSRRAEPFDRVEEVSA